MQYISGLLNSCGETIFDLMGNMFTGGNGCKLVGSLRNSAISGLEFKMPSTPVIKVKVDPSSRQPPWVFKSDDKVALP